MSIFEINTRPNVIDDEVLGALSGGFFGPCPNPTDPVIGPCPNPTVKFPIGPCPNPDANQFVPPTQSTH